MAAEQRREADRYGFGIFLEPLDQIFSTLERCARGDRKCGVVVEQRGDRREVAVTQLARAGDVIGEQCRPGHHEIMRFAGVLLHVGVRDTAAAARLVHDRHGR